MKKILIIIFFMNFLFLSFSHAEKWHVSMKKNDLSSNSWQ